MLTSLALLGLGVSTVSGQFVLEEHLGGKRAYPLGRRPRPSRVPATCDADPMQVLFTLRHGHRSKDPEDLVEYRDTVDFLRTISHPDLEWAQEYELPGDFIDSNEDQLTTQGRFEQFRLGKRYARRYPSLLDNYRPSHHVFYPMRATSRDRTVESGVSFGLGFFQRQGRINFGGQPLPVVRGPDDDDTEDFILRFKECNRWDVDLDADAVLNDKQDSFYDQTAVDVAQRLSDDYGVAFNSDQAEIIWDACQIMASLEEWDGANTWCSLLSNEEILKFEYGEDLGDYYKYGIGSLPETSFLASDWLKLAVEDMDAAVAGDGVRSRMMFGHSSTILPILNMLNIYMDQDELPTDSIKEDRLFKQSWVLHMSSHVALELYSCADEPVVRVVVNEKEAKIPACSSVFCPLSEFKAIFQPQLDFDLKAYCES